MLTSYKLFTIKAMSCNISSPQDFKPSHNGKATCKNPLLNMHKALQNLSKDGNTSCTILQLLQTIAKHDQKLVYNLRKAIKNAADKELIRKLDIIDHSIEFDDKCRNIAIKRFWTEKEVCSSSCNL